MDKYSYINNAHPEYIDQMYQEFLKDPDSVENSWRTFFEGFQYGQNGTDAHIATSEISTDKSQKEFSVINLINAYRTRGHLFTKTNPVRERRPYSPTLDLENFKLSESDLETTFAAATEIGLKPSSLKDILEHLQETYCKSIGAEYMFIRIPKKQQWIRERMESTRNRPNFTIDEKRRILQKLNEAVIFEKFLHTKYTGQKRFSLQGGETLIPALDSAIEYGAEQGIEELMIGTAHRGRLNVLANILNKNYEDIFSEFEGEEYADFVFSGDVKYHLGYTSQIATQNGKKVKLGLAPNPSHLEVSNPVVAGMVKAKIDYDYQGNEDRIAPIMIHGDAAIAGQGVVYELIQMSLLHGYRTGGTIHIVINNQIGFTTNYLQGRSSTYCTDVAKVTHSPVFHVNADDAEAVVATVRMAIDYRQKFHTDVFIDLLGYRRYGHNEGDEPRFTQPKLYATIAKHPDPREIYINKLRASDQVDQNLAKEMEKNFKSILSEKLDEVRSNGHKKNQIKNSTKKVDFEFSSEWHQDISKNRYYPIPATVFPEGKLKNIAKHIFTLPADYSFLSKTRKLYDERLNKTISGKNIDWGTAEFLAYASILDEGHPVRLSGQDSERGTFSHRHAVLRDEQTEELYLPLNHVSDEQAYCRIFNSLLSEYAEMGFEYGYANASPNGLTIWEAQFGDFFNGAQIVIDQFLSSSESKWQRTNGLVLYLPHGYEGQGPEHSNARIERFLQLSAKNNWRISMPSTPASFYHLLRTQVKYPVNTPLIVFTPKKLLRLAECVSTIKELADGAFNPVLDDQIKQTDKIKRIIFCTGKIFYDLDEYRVEHNIKDIAIVRIELLYPFPENEIKAVRTKYNNAKEIYWVQEEPENYGPWIYFKNWFGVKDIVGVYRTAGSAPATGFNKSHAIEQNEIIQKALKRKAIKGKQ